MGAFYFMSYSKKLQNPNWQKKRLEILSRDNFQCISCGSNDKELHVHHRWYQFGKEIWDYPDSCFETLCHECHEYIEMCIKDSTTDLQVMLRKTLLNQDDYSCFLNLLNSVSYDSQYSKFSPLQIADAINYISDADILNQIIELRNNKFQ